MSLDYTFGTHGETLKSDKMSRSEGKLTIRDFPELGFQLHIHEEPNGSAHFWDYARSLPSVPISSYNAAMADAGTPAYNAMENLQRLLSVDKRKNSYYESVRINGADSVVKLSDL